MLSLKITTQITIFVDVILFITLKTSEHS